MTPPHSPRSPRVVALSESVYRWLLHAYPGPFRRAYGREMAQVFRQTCWAAHARAGVGGVALLWLPLLGDVIINAVRERVATPRRNAEIGSGVPGDGRGARALWLGWTAAGAVAWGGGQLGAILLQRAVERFIGLQMAGARLSTLGDVATQGLLLAVVQALLIRRYAGHIRWWGWATAGAVLLTLAAVTIGMRGDITAQSNTYLVILLVQGALVGGAQWFALRRRVARAGWWVLATALGWAVGEGARILMLRLYFDYVWAVASPWFFPAVFILGTTLGGALYGALLGRLLVALLRQTTQAADLPA